MTRPSDTSEIVLYQTEDGKIKIDTVFQDETIWLTQAKMAELFDVKRPAVTRHLKNIFESGELDFIINYDIKYRMGKELDSDGGDDV